MLALLLACARPGVSPPPMIAAQPPPPPADLVYLVMVDRFSNGNPDNDGAIDLEDPQAWHGGDLQGITSHLDELAAMGVKTLWLTPISASRQEKFGEWGAFHGYWVEELATPEPRFGTPEDVRDLSEALHARGMRLVLDMVYNHVAPDASLVDEHPDWFHPAESIEDWSDPVQLVEGQVHGLPDLDQDNPAVYAHLLSATQAWIELAQPDAIRIDALRHMSPDFVHRIATDLREATGPGFRLFGEDFTGNPSALAETWGQTGVDHVYDFPFYFALVDVFCDDQPPGRLASVLSVDRLYAHPERLLTFVDNHDLPRIISRCHGDAKRATNALAFLMYSRGTPVITWGTEIAMEGEEEPANRGDMRFGSKLPWGQALADSARERTTHPVLPQGSSTVVALDDEVLVVYRASPAGQALVAMNQGAKQHTFSPSALLGPHPDGDFHSDWELPPGDVSMRVTDEAGSPLPRPLRTLDFTIGEIPEGERWLVVGSAPELGAWNPGDGMPLAAGSNPLELHTYEAAAYKLVRIDAEGGIHWEDAENRFLWVPPGNTPLSFPLDWREPSP